MIYIDTSGLLKLVLPDLQSEATREAVFAENSLHSHRFGIGRAWGTCPTAGDFPGREIE
jgi:hypothetical protein